MIVWMIGVLRHRLGGQRPASLISWNFRVSKYFRNGFVTLDASQFKHLWEDVGSTASVYKGTHWHSWMDKDVVYCCRSGLAKFYKMQIPKLCSKRPFSAHVLTAGGGMHFKQNMTFSLAVGRVRSKVPSYDGRRISGKFCFKQWSSPIWCLGTLPRLKICIWCCLAQSGFIWWSMTCKQEFQERALTQSFSVTKYGSRVAERAIVGRSHCKRSWTSCALKVGAP